MSYKTVHQSVKNLKLMILKRIKLPPSREGVARSMEPKEKLTMKGKLTMRNQLPKTFHIDEDCISRGEPHSLDNCMVGLAIIKSGGEEPFVGDTATFSYEGKYYGFPLSSETKKEILKSEKGEKVEPFMIKADPKLCENGWVKLGMHILSIPKDERHGVVDIQPEELERAV